jgi:membrane fusion protein (multidrug efflux system)
MNRNTTLALAVIAAAAALYLLLPSTGDAPGATVAPAKVAPQVAVHSVALRPLADRTEALGTTRALESVEIAATVTERIAQVHFSDGQWVEAGAVLVTLQQDEERAQLADERANLQEQQRELARLQDLVKRRLASQAELDQRQTLLTRSRHRIEEIEARLADLSLRAPFAGQVGLRRVSPGALVQPGTMITTLDQTTRMKLDFRIPAALLTTLKTGQTVLARTSSYDQTFTGTVVAIDSRVDPVDRSVGVLAEFDNPAQLLKPGLLMTVELQRQARQALMVPEETLVAQQMQQFVWVVDPATQIVSRRPVEIGTRVPGWVEITGGVAVGEWLIQEGVSVVRDGMTVIVKSAGNATDSAATAAAEVH